MAPIAASVRKDAVNPASARMKPAETVPTIWPTLVTALRRPSWTLLWPGSSLARDHVAGQNAARASTNSSCPTNRGQKPRAKANSTAPSASSTHEPIMIFRPPIRSV